jgi:dihydroorotate dehydrogenase (NAD+) catalytic subunit
MGGIVSAEDAVEFILAGASAIAIGTGNFMNPKITLDILQGIKSYMKTEDIKSIKELKGGVQC